MNVHGNAVWALDTGRPGEFMQVEILGRALGLVFERIRLSPEGDPAALPAIPPRLILSFGRAARTALRLAAGCTARPLLVHLGTPGQTPITAFDLIIPMPQDDYPPARNVQFLRFPLNGGGLAEIPPPPKAGSCTLIIGGPTRHVRMPLAALRKLIRFGIRLAQANGEPLQVVTSPRTPVTALNLLRRMSGSFALHEFGGRPFASILQSSSRFVVTADSASMLAEACRTGAPVWLFPLPPRPNFSDLLQHATDRFLGASFRHLLVRRGWVGGGTDFHRWHRKLESLGYIRSVRHLPEAALHWMPAGPLPDNDLSECQARVLALL